MLCRFINLHTTTNSANCRILTSPISTTSCQYLYCQYVAAYSKTFYSRWVVTNDKKLRKTRLIPFGISISIQWFTVVNNIHIVNQMKPTDQGLNFISGIGTHVKVTVSSRNGLRPQMSDRAPISGALRNDSRPWTACTCTPQSRITDITVEVKGHQSRSCMSTFVRFIEPRYIIM